MTNIRKISSNSYNFSYKYFINGLFVPCRHFTTSTFQTSTANKTNNKTDVNTQTF